MLERGRGGAAAVAALRSIPGVGEWTAAEILQRESLPRESLPPLAGLEHSHRRVVAAETAHRTAALSA
jgi:3-methyladenine DNA glycosylase/8-oxoguanine DNA glycosylase